MEFKDVLYDEQLHIKTEGRDDTRANNYNYPYEPTNYKVLERLAGSGYISKKSRLVDYGSGKGRVSFYLAYETGCHAIGVEYNERLFNKALSNLENYTKRYNVEFVNINAVDYVVPDNMDSFFFFNPFSEEILKSVLKKIKESYYRNCREMKLFFYYPSDEYVAVLTTDTELSFIDEIDCRDMFPGDNNRERILIFEVG